VFGASPVFAGDEVSTDEEAATVSQDVQQDKWCESLKGFTVGLDVVYSHTDVRHDWKAPVVENPTTGARVQSRDATPQISQSRCFVDPSINVGYSYLKNNFYVGAVGDVSFGKKAEITDDIDGAGSEIKTEIGNISYGIKLKGGYYARCLKSAFYGIAGVKWRDANLRYVLNGEEGSKAKVKTPFFVLGLGMERPIRNKISFSAEYECAWRNSTKTSTTGGGHTFMEVDHRLRENTLKLGIKYHI
jgi:hypothetical protein